MPVVNVSESKLVEATPDKVYAILAQPKHHVHILPESFQNYREEADGTIAFDVKYGAATRSFRVRTEEVEPNRVFREVQESTCTVTDFILNPQSDGTLVTIRTRYETPATIAGWLESMFAPMFMRKLYDEELTKLCRYVLVADV